jgi:hypothetical protein
MKWALRINGAAAAPRSDVPPEKAPRRYAPRKCRSCRKEFNPTGPRSAYCDDCRGLKAAPRKQAPEPEPTEEEPVPTPNLTDETIVVGREPPPEPLGDMPVPAFKAVSEAADRYVHILLDHLQAAVENGEPLEIDLLDRIEAQL